MKSRTSPYYAAVDEERIKLQIAIIPRGPLNIP